MIEISQNGGYVILRDDDESIAVGYDEMADLIHGLQMELVAMERDRDTWTPKHQESPEAQGE